MSKITGLGGVFLHIGEDAGRLLQWYRDVLELGVTEYGINFLAPNKFTLITFDSKTAGQAVLNFTVDDLDCFLEKLTCKGVKVIQNTKVYEFGKFARIEDPYGNAVELWEPFDENYIQMVQKEITESHSGQAE